MNFLAHLYLSGNNEKVMIGNFIGDHIRGNNFNTMNDGIIKGIKLHRLIDTFTDTHTVVTESKKRLRPVFHKYAPVIVDIFYDHFLAKNWNTYSEVPLQDYADYVYALLAKNKNIFPQRTQYMLPHMIANNWLFIYSTTDGINRVLKGMSKRATFDSKMENAATYLIKDYSLYENEFYVFFKDLKKYCENQLAIFANET